LRISRRKHLFIVGTVDPQRSKGSRKGKRNIFCSCSWN